MYVKGATNKKEYVKWTIYKKKYMEGDNKHIF